MQRHRYSVLAGSPYDTLFSQARDLEDAATDHHFATLVLASDLEERAEDRAQSLARQAAVDEAQSLAASQAAQGVSTPPLHELLYPPTLFCPHPTAARGIHGASQGTGRGGSKDPHPGGRRSGGGKEGPAGECMRQGEDVHPLPRPPPRAELQVAKRAERQAAAEVRAVRMGWRGLPGPDRPLSSLPVARQCMALIRSEAGERRAFESTQRAREQAAEVAAIRAALDEAARTGKATVRGRRHIPSAAAGALSGNPTSFTEPGSGGGGPPLALPSRSSILAQPGSHDEATDKRAIDYDASAAAATEAALAAVAMARRAERRTEYLASVIKVRAHEGCSSSRHCQRAPIPLRCEQREEADRGRVWERAVRADATEAAALRTAEVTAAEAAIAATGRGVRATALRTQMHASDVKHDDTLASRRHGQAGSESAFAIPETRSSDLDLDSLARVLARFRGPIASGATIGDHAPA